MVLEKIKELLKEHLDCDTESINEQTTLEELGIDSLETVEILMELEDEFGIEIPASEVGKTVGSLVEYIEKVK